MPSRHQETAEAVCSALWRTGFDAIGETEGGRVSWFHRGDRPKDVRVRVERSPIEAELRIVVEWRNLSGVLPRKGEQVLHIQTGPLAQMAEIQEATTNAVVRVLEIYRDVLGGAGVAGPTPQAVPES